MGTPAIISVYNSQTGTVKTVAVSLAGKPDSTGFALSVFHNTQAKADRLVQFLTPLNDVVTSLHVQAVPFTQADKFNAFEYGSMEEFKAKHWQGWENAAHPHSEWRFENATVAQRKVHSYLFQNGKWFVYAKTKGEFSEIKVKAAAKLYRYLHRDPFTEERYGKVWGYSTYFRQWVLRHSRNTHCPMLANVAVAFHKSQFNRASAGNG